MQILYVIVYNFMLNFQDGICYWHYKNENRLEVLPSRLQKRKIACRK